MHMGGISVTILTVSLNLAQVSGSQAVGCVRLCVSPDCDRALLLRQVRSVLERARLHELFVELLDR